MSIQFARRWDVRTCPGLRNRPPCCQPNARHSRA
jgi:hypothetical protein